MAKTLWRDRNESLDPETDYVEIYQNLALYEFTWDLTQALSFALFRTYAVPSIGRLLDQTGAFTGAVQKRYDDTALLLEAPFVHGFDSEAGRTAMRRINQMHRMYDISNDDFRYVLSTSSSCPSAGSTTTAGARSPTPSCVRASTTTAPSAVTWGSRTSPRPTTSSCT